jgi:hypothetical protein
VIALMTVDFLVVSFLDHLQAGNNPVFRRSGAAAGLLKSTRFWDNPYAIQLLVGN